MPHLMHKMFDKVTTVATSIKDDLREFSNMSIQVVGLEPGDQVRLYASLMEENETLIPVKVEGNDLITENRVYIIPPIYRFYQFRIVQKLGTSPVTLYLYAIMEGSFMEPYTMNITTTPGNYAGFGSQRSGSAPNGDGVELTSNMIEYPDFRIPILANDNIYLSHIVFTTQGSGSKVQVLYVPQTGAETLLFDYAMTPFTPSIVDPIHGFHKIDRDVSQPGRIEVRAKKFGLDRVFLSGRINLIATI